MVVFVHDGQAVQLVLPDNVVGLLQSGLLGGGDELGAGGHEVADLFRRLHPGNPVVPAGDNAQQLSVGGAVGGDGHGGEAVSGLQRQHVRQGGIRSQIGSGGDEAGLIALHLGHHGSLILNALGAENEADAALLGQGNGQGIVGNGLHDGGGQRHVQAESRLFHALAVLDQGGLQADPVRDAVLGGIAGDEQILAEGVAGFRIVISHWGVPPVSLKVMYVG